MSRDGGSRGHRRRDQVRAALIALPPLEIAVRGRSAALAGCKLVGIHAETHRAAGLAPLEAGTNKDLVEPLGLCLLFHEAGAGHDHGADFGVNLFAVDDTRSGAQILDAAVGART